MSIEKPWESRQALMEHFLKINKVPQDVVNAWIWEMTDEQVEEELTLRKAEKRLSAE